MGATTYGFAYNSRNRLILTQVDGTTAATYGYNALGQRISKTASYPQASVERFAYDEAGQLIGEYGTTNRDYLWLGNLPVGVIDNTINGSVVTSTVNYVTADHMGTPRAVSNSAGTTIWSWAYQGNPFGEQQPTSTTGYVLNLRFPGQYYDAESNTDNNGFRTYEPATGQYLQSDPIGLAGGFSTYAYAGNNPLNNIDPQGLCQCQGVGNAPAPDLYQQRGQLANNMMNSPDPYGMAPAAGEIYNLGQLVQFQRGGALDAQVRYGGSTAYANYVFGVYMSASGATLSQALSGAQDYAQHSGATRTYGNAGYLMDQNYPGIPVSNVENITQGYNDQQNGTLCTIGGN